MNKSVKQNLITYHVFLVIAVVGLFYGKSIREDYSVLRVWEWSNIFMLFIGLPFLFFQQQARLPDFWEKGVSRRNRFFIPVLIGIGFGLLDVLIIKVMMHPEPYKELPPFLQPFPYSLFLYFSGALEIEVFYRLIPLTLILLIGSWYKKGKFYNAFFWAGAILTAIREPLEQLPGGNAWFIIYSLVTGMAMNLLQAVWYKKSGFLASLTLRLGHYLIWHILLGIFVEYFELAK
jgi:hypothetical protein